MADLHVINNVNQMIVLKSNRNMNHSSILILATNIVSSIFFIQVMYCVISSLSDLVYRLFLVYRPTKYEIFI